MTEQVKEQTTGADFGRPDLVERRDQYAAALADLKTVPLTNEKKLGLFVRHYLISSLLQNGTILEKQAKAEIKEACGPNVTDDLFNPIFRAACDRIREYAQHRPHVPA